MGPHPLGYDMRRRSSGARYFNSATTRVTMPSKSTSDLTPRWGFRTKLRRSAFGWRGSRAAIARIDEAVAEIRAVARRDPTLAAQGAVLFLEKVSPAVCEVDSSSGALGSATYHAVDALVPIIAAASVPEAVRSKWLERLFNALQDDDPPYIESLGDHWGDLCVTVGIASRWADELLPLVKHVVTDRRHGVFAFFKGTNACYSALFKAGRHDELLELLELDQHPIWPYSVWGGRVLVARGQVDEAIAYMRRRSGINVPLGALARFAEDAFLDVGRRAEAYARYAIDANQGNSRIATYRALGRKYPEIDADRLLADLIASTPGEEGKWFATAKSLKRFDLALALAQRSPCDPKTLTRAARDHLESHPEFAAEAALAALHWIAHGYGYEIAGVDVMQAHRLAKEAAAGCGRTEQIQSRVEAILSDDGAAAKWMREVLGAQDPAP